MADDPPMLPPPGPAYAVAPPAPEGVPGTVTGRGLQLCLAALTRRLGGAANVRRLRAGLTLTERPAPGRPKAYARRKIAAYEVDPPWIYLPRPKIPALRASGVLGVLADTRPPPRAVPAERRRVAQDLSAYQRVAADYLCAGPFGADRVAAGCAAAYLQMGTGLGKTRLACDLAARLGVATLVVVPTLYIQGQWLDEIAATCPDLRRAAYANKPPGRRRPAPDFQSHDILVGVVNTIRAKPPEFYDGCGFLVIDETHELCSPSSFELLRRGQPRYVLGLSATPEERLNGLDRAIFQYLGPPIRAEKIPDCDVAAYAYAGRVREVQYAGHPDHCQPEISAAGSVSAIGTIGRIILDPARLVLVAAETERLYRLHEGPSAAAYGLTGGLRHGVLVFAEHREYLPALRDALVARFGAGIVAVPELDGEAGEEADEGVDEGAEGAGLGAPPATPTVLRGGATAEVIGEALRARVVLTTYGYSRRGVSLVDMTAMVLATPRRHGHRQILGRILRRGSDERIVRVVVDIRDICTPLKTQSTTRRQIYKEKEYPIYRVGASHTDFENHAAGFAAAPAGEKLFWAPVAAVAGPAPAAGPPPEPALAGDDSDDDGPQFGLEDVY